MQQLLLLLLLLLGVTRGQFVKQGAHLQPIGCQPVQRRSATVPMN